MSVPDMAQRVPDRCDALGAAPVFDVLIIVVRQGLRYRHTAAQYRISVPRVAKGVSAYAPSVLRPTREGIPRMRVCQYRTWRMVAHVGRALHIAR
eukprot:1692997-Rhodomonas_salina.1